MRDFRSDNFQDLAISDINELARTDPAQLIALSESNYRLQVEEVVDRVVAAGGRYRILLLAGPSGSGKTTTAEKLAEAFQARGVGAQVISLDNFFKNGEDYPVLPDGTKDFESVYTLDIDMIHFCLGQLLREGRSTFPIFDFYTTRRAKDGVDITLKEGDVLIIEGIHALNPLLRETLPEEKLLKLYVSVGTCYVWEGQRALAPKGIRLMRRMVRDNNFRNYLPIQTMSRWDRVLEGEQEFIYPFRDCADLVIDSTIYYEPCVFHQYLLPLLDLSAAGEYADRLQGFFDALGLFAQVDPALIPENSLLREFIG